MAKQNKYQWDKTAAEDEDVFVSRSQKKRDSTALQKLGEELAQLSVSQLKDVPLTPDLREALTELARIRDKEGRRRQMQYLGRLMREADGEAIRTAVEAVKLGQTRANQTFHHAERLRDALLQVGEAAQDELLQAWPAEREDLRALVRAAQEEKRHAAPPKAARELFRRLHALLQA